ncbi:MAG: protein translocase subunit SecD [Clostridia bacterium]|nr:protein translocase subunit SecD [Clostridia bacterium]
MKKRSVITLCVTVLLIVLVSVVALKGFQIPGSSYDYVPVKDAISLGLDLRGGIYAVYQGDTSAEDFDTQMDATVTIMINRLTAQGYTEATVTRQGSDRIRIEIPDVEDPNEILNIVGTPAHLTFEDPNGDIVLEGNSVKEAYGTYDRETNKPVIAFTLDDEGTKAFADATATFLNQVITIRLDETVLTAPTVQSVITDGRGIINGFNDINDAITIANLIMSGALPLDITLIESSAVSATLGEGALSTSLTAGIIGILLIMLFMIVMYRIPGVVADMALCIYILIVFFALANVPGVQLTLPGIAGILLGIGMAVDGNVIIFERFREELKGGRTVQAAAQRGYKNALSSIIDSNVTTIIAAIVLVYFGTGSVKGFALTLLIGVIASLISSVFITRFLLNQATRLGIKGDKLWSR